jgi:hypothetical protein
MTDYDKLVGALRICSSELNCGDCPLFYRDSCSSDELMNDAADAIEALQAQLPKRGEWIGVSPTVDTVQCSVCGGQLFSAELETPYCPYCGAKMEVQDG